MAIVKRVFSIPDDVSEKLNESIPSRERSKFVTRTLAEALSSKNKRELLKYLDGLELDEEKNKNEKSVVEVLREIRQAESKRLVDHS